jgi:hypothetical protein
MNWLRIRSLPRNDSELEEQAGIKPADTPFVTPAAYQAARRRLLGPGWGKRRRPYRPR